MIPEGAQDEIDGGLRLGGGREDRLVVRLEHLQPVREILRVILAHRRRDLEPGAQKRRADLGHELLYRVGFGPEALAEIAIAARGPSEPPRVC
jgi:hypothetical protein